MTDIDPALLTEYTRGVKRARRAYNEQPSVFCEALIESDGRFWPCEATRRPGETYCAPHKRMLGKGAT